MQPSCPVKCSPAFNLQPGAFLRNVSRSRAKTQCDVVCHIVTSQSYVMSSRPSHMTCLSYALSTSSRMSCRVKRCHVSSYVLLPLLLPKTRRGRSIGTLLIDLSCSHDLVISHVDTSLHLSHVMSSLFDLSKLVCRVVMLYITTTLLQL